MENLSRARAIPHRWPRLRRGLSPTPRVARVPAGSGVCQTLFDRGKERTIRMHTGLRRYVRTVTAIAWSKSAVGAGFVMSGNLGSGVLRFTVTLILAGALSEADMGYLAVYVALMDMVSVFCESGLHATLVRFMSAQPDKRPQPLILKCLGIKAVLALISVPPLIIGSRVYFSVQEIPEAHRWAYPLAIAAGLLLSFNALGMAIMQGRQRYGLYSILAVSINVLRLAAIGLLLVMKIQDPRLYVAVFFTVPAVAVVVALILVSAMLPRKGAGAPHAEAVGATATYGALLAFMAPLALAQVLAIILLRGDVMMLKAMVAAEEVGSYFLANQVAFAFPLLTQAVFTVLLPKVTAMKTASELKRYRRLVFQSVPILAVLTVAAMLAAPLLLRAVYGGRYSSAGPIVRLLILSYGINIIVNPLSLIFYAVGRTHYIPLMHAAQLAVFFAANWLLIPIYAGLGAAITGILIRLLGVVFVIVFTAKVIKKKEAFDLGGVSPPVSEP